MVKPIWLAPGQRGLERLHAFFEIAADVLDHHNGVVHHESGGDGERHQRQVVERVAEQVHHRERAHQRQRHGDRGNDGGAQAAQEQEDDQHHQPDGQHQLKLHVVHRRLNAGRHIGQRGHVDGGGQVRFQLRQNLVDRVDDGDGIGARLALNVENHCRRLVHPGGQLGVLHAVVHIGHVLHEYRRAVAIGHHHVLILVGRGDLIVGVDLVVETRAVEVALGGVDA